jgi:IclR family pca regulon transcriptional regulator
MISTDSRSKEQVAALARGLSVLLAFGETCETLTISQVAIETGLTPASARRVLLTLKELGYVDQAGRRFYLTAKVLDLGYSYLASQPIWQIVQPALEKLRSEFTVTTNAAVLQGTDIIYAVRVPCHRVMPGLINTGTRHPAHLTAMGRVILANLAPLMRESVLARIRFKPLTPHSVTDEGQLRKIIESVQSENYSIVDQELELGLRSIAVPIRDRSGKAIAAMNASGHANMIETEYLMSTVLPAMFKAADEISCNLPA